MGPRRAATASLQAARRCRGRPSDAQGATGTNSITGIPIEDRHVRPSDCPLLPFHRPRGGGVENVVPERGDDSRRSRRARRRKRDVLELVTGTRDGDVARSGHPNPGGRSPVEGEREAQVDAPDVVDGGEELGARRLDVDEWGTRVVEQGILLSRDAGTAIPTRRAPVGAYIVPLGPGAEGHGRR